MYYGVNSMDQWTPERWMAKPKIYLTKHNVISFLNRAIAL